MGHVLCIANCLRWKSFAVYCGLIDNHKTFSVKMITSCKIAVSGHVRLGQTAKLMFSNELELSSTTVKLSDLKQYAIQYFIV